MNEDEEKLRKDGTQRKAHYGDGKQPWDVIKRLGWGPEFAAGNVLKYLRRTKDPEHSLQSAVWYFNELVKLTLSKNLDSAGWAVAILKDLKNELTDEEKAKLA